ncbi:MAG: suppressor of fused domain protein [Betaproteobacteria bacterium]|nr:suppressor of fused domain protein [Betaproteobacteria bacterium]
MRRPVSEKNRRIGKYIAQVFGGRFKVKEYLDDTESITVDILSCADRPSRGVTSYSTIGLSDSAIPWGDEEFPTRIELAGACTSDANAFPNILASAAFLMLRNRGVFHPGAVIENYVRLYLPDTFVPHLYFTTPFLWPGIAIFKADEIPVTWLQAMPISDAERKYLHMHGDLALEKLFRERHVDSCNLDRQSVI